MKDRIRSFLIELCCVYTLVSVLGAIVNMFVGSETNNLNVLIMFSMCFIATLVLFMHKLFDSLSPLAMIVIQYLAACGLCALLLLILSAVIEPITPRGWFEFWRSFTIPYIVLAGFYYYRVFREAKEQSRLLSEIQEAKKEDKK